MTTSESYLKDLAETLYKFQQKNVLCDTVLIADDYHVWAHSIILAAASPYVYTRFLMITGHKAKYRFSLKLAGCEAACVKAVLHFLYTGSLVLSANFQQPEVFAGILQVCVKLGINVTKLNGAAVKFVDVDPYAVSIESNENDLKLSEESVQGTSLDSCLENESRPSLSNDSENISSSDIHNDSRHVSGFEGEILKLIKDEDIIQLHECNSCDIKLEMGVFEPVSNCDDDVKIEDRTGIDIDTGIDSELSSTMTNCQTTLFVTKDTSFSTSGVPAQASTNSQISSGSESQNFRVSAGWRNASVRLASKILRNTIQKRKRQLRSVCQGAERSESLAALPLENSGNGIRERLKNYKKENVVCPLCNKRFKWLSDLRKHMETYQGHSSLTCSECGKVLTCKRQLRAHEKLHSGHRLHVCPTCGKVYRHRSGLVMHSYEHTGQLPYLCDLCGAGFKNFFSMGQHKKRRHSTFRPFVCQECGKGFIRNVLLLRHMKVHSGEKQNICPQCGMAFGYSGNLSRHMRSHVGDKPHSCGICGRGFNRIDHLQSHALTHSRDKTGPGEFTCTDCQKVFKSPWLLKRHMMLHSDSNSYNCHICAKRFTGSTRLKQHMVTHEEKQFRCSACGKTFSFERFLMIHLKKCHLKTGSHS